MFKDVVRALDSGLLPEIGLLAFLFAFVLIVVRVLLMRKSRRNEMKQLPLDDPAELTPETNHRHDEPVS